MSPFGAVAVALGLIALCVCGLIIRRRSRPALVPWKEADWHFLDRGMQYYIAGRFCALAQQFPVCANLLHHSLEMFLKGALCRGHSKIQLQLMGHNIWKAWVAFKHLHPDPRLNEFDGTVKALNKFERIRYPDQVLTKGMAGSFELFHEHESNVQSYSATTPPQYKLNL